MHSKFLLSALMLGLCANVTTLQAAEPEVDSCGEPKIYSATITEETLVWFMKEVIEPCLSKKKHVEVVLMTAGGDPSFALGVYDAIQIYGDPAHLTIVAVGKIASAGVTLAVSGGYTKVGCNTSFIFHDPSNTSGIGGTTDVLQGAATFIEDTRNRFIAVIERETDITDVLETVRRGKAFNAEAALTVGLADEIVGCFK